jgi:hypothetical protein
MMKALTLKTAAAGILGVVLAEAATPQIAWLKSC